MDIVGRLGLDAETLEKAGDLPEALRWMNLGLHASGGRTERDGLEATAVDLLVLLVVRRRVRLTLGLPPDDGDRLAGPALSGR